MPIDLGRLDCSTSLAFAKKSAWLAAAVGVPASIFLLIGLNVRALDRLAFAERQRADKQRQLAAALSSHYLIDGDLPGVKPSELISVVADGSTQWSPKEGPTAVEDGGFVLMPSELARAAAVWLVKPIDANRSFIAAFDVDMSEGQARPASGYAKDPAQGGDGFAIVMQDGGFVVGRPAAGIGYQGIGHSLAVEFDNFIDTPAMLDSNRNDPPKPHVALMLDGVADHSQQVSLLEREVIPPATTLSLAPDLLSIDSDHSGEHFRIRIQYRGGDQPRMRVDATAGEGWSTLIDATLRSSEGFAGPDGRTYFGFTSGTGSAAERIVITNLGLWSA